MPQQIGSDASKLILCERNFITADRQSFPSKGGVPAALSLPFTGERIVPGKVEEGIFREHEARYLFAGRLVKDKQVLDLACGTGIGTYHLLKAGAQTCVGLDIDKGAIDYARDAYKGCVFAQCNATSLCLPDASVDVVVSFETIEHVQDQMNFLLECKRVLRPRGILVCSTPNRTMFRWEKKNPYHIHELSVLEFKKLVETMFMDVQLYSQKNEAYLLYVPKTLTLRLLDQLKLKNTVKRILGWKPAPTALRSEFDGNRSNSDSEIRPYQADPLAQPLYIIAVGRKPPASPTTTKS